ncbi:protein RNA-directed DNA methylation 3 isoform X2 [Canna indica]|uniref:Protein RNA-directed DNA methylation 3 isoform X2 n=1 Tax=Canna indica TaxID=4628 RepID=A0AAQ3Q2D4_9LILI|nr:protein RNA-directed DNA methylation 3 isoform X2 [Canna indica]
MAMKGKGKQVARKAPVAPAAGSSSAKRKAAASEHPGASSSKGKKKRRRMGVLQYFDDAAVDDDSDYEDDEDLDMEEEHEVLDDYKLESNNVRGVGKSHQLPFFVKEEELSGDELEELIKERYNESSGYVVYNDDSAEGDDKGSGADELKDVTIWRVKCMAGRERQLAFCLMEKYVQMDNLGTKLQIVSAFALEHVKGYVFVEADKLSGVIEACKGFCSVYVSRSSVVPRSEIPTLFACRNKLSKISIGTWVRLKSGNYKGDLAKVVAVDEGKKRVTVKLVPRIDLQAIAKKFGGGVSLKLAAVPPPRLISSRELEIFRPHIELRHDRQTGEVFEVLDGMMLKDGYLYKKVSIESLVFWGVQPSSSELLMFSDGTKDTDEDLNWVSGIYNARKKKPITESDDKVSAVTKNGYGLHDLVLFGRKNFGVILAIEKDCCKILRGDIEGAEVMTVKMQDVKNSCDDKMFTALDWKGKTIFIDDIVRTFVGPSEGREGSVKHMYKGTLFIQVKNEIENTEFFCAKSKSCEKTNESKDSRGSKLGKGKAEPSPSFLQSPMRMDNQENDNDRGSTRHRRSDNEQTFSIGQTLRIREGPLKGYLCRVVRIYRSDVTVKLDSLVKLITVKDKSLAVPKLKGDSSTSTIDHFAREMLSTAGISFGGTSAEAEKSAWESVVPSLGSDSWQPFSTSNSSAWNNENKTDQGHEADAWGKAMDSVAGQEQVADPWSSKVTCADRTGDGWGEPSNSWALEKARTSEKGSDDWSKNASNEKSKLSMGDAGCGWDVGSDTNNNDSSWDGKGKGKVNSAEDSWGDVAKSQEKINDRSSGAALDRMQDNASSWDSNGKGKINSAEDAWGKSEKLQDKSNNGLDALSEGCTLSTAKLGCWDDAKVQSASQSDGWVKTKEKTDAEIGSSIGELSSQGKDDSWDKVASSKGTESCWQKGVDHERHITNDQMDNWDKPNNSQDGHGAKTENDNWAQRGGWNEKGDLGQTSTGEIDGQNHELGRKNGNNWSRQRDFDGDKQSSWGRGQADHGTRGSMGFDAGDGEKKWSSGREGDRARGRGRGRGRDQGHFGEAEGRRNNFDDTSTFDQLCNWDSKGQGHFGEAEGRRNNFDDTSTFDQLCNWDSKGHGVTQTSDWENQQNGGGGSSWANDKNAGWDEPSWDNKDAGGSGWNSVKESDGKQLSEVCEGPSRGAWDKPRADELHNNSKTSSDISSSWDRAKSNDEKGKCPSLDKSSNWTQPEAISSDKEDAWNIKGKRTVADDDSWGKTSVSQEKKKDTAVWGDDSCQKKEMSMLKSGNQTSSWDSTVPQSMHTAIGQAGSWEKATTFDNKSDQWKVASQTNDTEAGGWNQVKSWDEPNVTETGGWNQEKSWDKPNDTEAGGWNQEKSWDRPKSLGEGGCDDWNKIWNKTRETGSGFGRGRGRHNRDNGNDYNSDWNKDHGGERRSNWGRGRGGSDEDAGNQQSQWDRQGSSWGRGGRGRFGQRERNQDDNYDNSSGPPNQDGGQPGRGRGWGPGRGAGGQGQGQGRGRGRFFSSDRSGDGENVTGGNHDNKGWSSKWNKDEGNESNSKKYENNWGGTTGSVGGSHSAWDNWSSGTGDVSKTAGTSKDAQDAGDQGSSWGRTAGSWRENEGGGSKGGW